MTRPTPPLDATTFPIGLLDNSPAMRTGVPGETAPLGIPSPLSSPLSSRFRPRFRPRSAPRPRSARDETLSDHPSVVRARGEFLPDVTPLVK